MALTFEIHGLCCDLALHPISVNTAEAIQQMGSGIYKEKYMNWWRAGKTTTCGMRITEETLVRVSLDGKAMAFDARMITRCPREIRRSMYFSSKAKYLAVMGYDDELCGCIWKWNNVRSFDQDRLEFLVQQWDRIMGVPDYYVVDNVRYMGQFADVHQWCDSSGFNLIEPKVIDLDALRAQRGLAAAGPAGA